MQDDEAGLLFFLLRASHVRRVLEIGGNTGFSARAFVAALRPKKNARVYTIDYQAVPTVGPTHTVIVKDADNFTASDIGNAPIDLLLLDCHAYTVQKRLVVTLERQRLFGRHAYVALHDTGLHSRRVTRWAMPWRSAWSDDAEQLEKSRYIHQPVERLLARWLARRGWQRISVHDDDRESFPRHGLTLMQKLVDLGVPARVEMRKENLTMDQTGRHFPEVDEGRRDEGDDVAEGRRLSTCDGEVTVDQLNARFANGKPTSRLQYAGVVVRAFDGDLAHTSPTDIGWISRGQHPSNAVASASIVNARAPYAYAGGGLGDEGGVGLMGVVLSPSVVHAALQCSYARDGHSVMVKCLPGLSYPTGECVPGCVGMRVKPMATPTTLTFNRWCDANNRSTDYDSPAGPYAKPSLCAWRPSDVATMMEAHELWTARALKSCPRQATSARQPSSNGTSSGGGGSVGSSTSPPAVLPSAQPTAQPPLSPWCACLAQRPCCTFPACPMYNELLLQTVVLEVALKASHVASARTTPLVEAVYYIEPPGASRPPIPRENHAAPRLRGESVADTTASSSSTVNPQHYARAEEVARALHRRLVDAADAGGRVRTSTSHSVSDGGACTGAPPPLVAMDLTREQPFRWVRS